MPTDDEQVAVKTLHVQKALLDAWKKRHAQNPVGVHAVETGKIKDELRKATERNAMLEKELQDTQAELQQTKAAKQNNAIAKQNNIIAKRNLANANQNFAIAMNNYALEQKYYAAIKKDHDVAKRDRVIKELNKKIRSLELKDYGAVNYNNKILNTFDKFMKSTLKRLDTRTQSTKIH